MNLPTGRDDAEVHAGVRLHGIIGGRFVEVLACAALALTTFGVHSVGALLRSAYFSDEKWVAVSTRASFSRLPLVTSSSPIGWTALLRLVPDHGGLALRLVPLAFTASTVAVAYLLGRELRLLPLLTPVVVSAAVLLAPVMLIRNDLKQYTCDAFVTLVLLLLLARLESRWTRRRLVMIAAAGPTGMLLSHTAVFTMTAVLASLLLAAVVTRQRYKLPDLAVATVAAAGAMYVVYRLLDAPHRSSALTAFWSSNYVPLGHPVAAARFLHRGLAGVDPYLGSHTIVVPFLFIAAGLATLVYVRRYALALAVPLLAIVTMLASAAHLYPFLELRTNTFLLVSLIVLMAIGVVGLVMLVGRLHWLVAGVLAVTILALWVNAVRPYVRSPTDNPVFDSRMAVRYLDQHRRPRDVVLVAYASSYGFAYYERVNPGFRRSTGPLTTIGFIPSYPSSSGIVVAPYPRPGAVPRVVSDAEDLASKRGSHRVWIFVEEADYVDGPEWDSELRQLRPRQVVSVMLSPNAGLFLWQAPHP